MATTAFATGAYSAVQNLASLRGVSSGGGGGQDASSLLGGASGTGQSFGQMLSGVVDGVVESGRKAEAQAAAIGTGKTDIVNVVTAVAESETALQTLVAVRDRVISAYEEIMRMQI